MLNYPLRRWLAISCLAFITTACGGGGGSGGSNSATTSATTNSTSSATSSSPSTSTNVNRNVSLSWTTPTTREDGSPIAVSAIAGYRLFYTRDGSPSNEDMIVVINNGSITNTTISLAVAGTYTFAITAWDFEGNESPFSTLASITIN